MTVWPESSWAFPECWKITQNNFSPKAVHIIATLLLVFQFTGRESSLTLVLSANESETHSNPICSHGDQIEYESILLKDLSGLHYAAVQCSSSV